MTRTRATKRMKKEIVKLTKGDRMNRIVLAFFLAAATIIALPHDAGAAEEHYGKEDYGQLAGRKLGRGAANTALGWLELPNGISDVGEQHGIGAAATWGVIHGAGRAVQRTAVGIFEVLTFPFGVPQDFEPMIEPEFVLQDKVQR